MDVTRDMPEVVAGAVNSVMREVKRLLKSERNREAGYRFASIDDFLAAVNPLCAEAGLIILQDELDARLVNDGGNSLDRSWLWTTFTFTLAHKSGATYGPLTRSVMVPARGAQAFGSAQSYALKQFMRSLFQIPTGDGEDADFTAPRRLPDGCPSGRGQDYPGMRTVMGLSRKSSLRRGARSRSRPSHHALGLGPRPDRQILMRHLPPRARIRPELSEGGRMLLPPRIPKFGVPARKTKPARKGMSHDHLAFLRRLECPVYPGKQPVEAHHLLRVDRTRGMGRKAADRHAIPLSQRAHRELHDAGDEEALLAAKGIDGRALAAALWRISGELDAGMRIVYRVMRLRSGGKMED